MSAASAAARPAAPPVRATPATQDALARLLRADFDALDARLRRALAAVPPERRATRPPDGGWSVAEVVAHMVLVNAAYLPGMRAMVDGAAPASRPGAGPTDRPWRHAWLPGLLVRALASPRAMPAPRSVRPAPGAPARSLDELIATHDAVRALLARAEGMDWRAMRTRSPFAAVVRPNFGDACLIVLRHGERHAGQIERAAAAVA